MPARRMATALAVLATGQSFLSGRWRNVLLLQLVLAPSFRAQRLQISNLLCMEPFSRLNLVEKRRILLVQDAFLVLPRSLFFSVLLKLLYQTVLDFVASGRTIFGSSLEFLDLARLLFDLIVQLAYFCSFLSQARA
jgi:hypothetical protein